MKKYLAYRYKCDHCGKTGGAAGHMKTHEGRCTMNPNRTCGFCDITGEGPLDVSELVALIGGGTDEEFDKLVETTFGCPACILAAIRHSGVTRWDVDEDGEVAPNPAEDKVFEWRYKDAKRAFWEEYGPELRYGMDY